MTGSSELDRAARLVARVRALGARGGIVAARAPGRINLIGEHIDYSGLPVLPMAIDRATLVVAARRDDAEIELHNLAPDFGSRRFALSVRIPAGPAGDWGNYVKAAIQGVIEHGDAGAAGALRGGLMVVDGNVPAAAGMASSAALTVASALAFMALNAISMPALETAEMVARSEWYVGTMAGGMDQAASLLGRPGHAIHIEFNPLRATPVRMPPEVAVVVADSGEVADKSGRARAEYNRRVIECALGARLLARALGIGGVRIMGDVVRRLDRDRWEPEPLLDQLARLAPRPLDSDLIDAARLLDTTPEALARDLTAPAGAHIDFDSMAPLQVLRRARHVLSETRRVERAVAALRADRLDELGDLLDRSHQSLAEDFEVSTPRLDAMVECARGAGALGARLTGAGFGGSIIALCRAESAPGVIAALHREYYARFASPGREPMRSVVRAGAGAGMVDFPSF